MRKSHILSAIFLLLILTALASAGCSSSTPSPTSALTLTPEPTPTTSVQDEEDQSPVEFVWMLTGEEAGFTLALGSTIDLEGNLLVIVESDDYRIMKFDSDGNFLTGWGSSGIGEGEFTYIPGVSYDALAVDAQGNIFATDMVSDRVQKFDKRGNYLTHWGSNASFGKGKLIRPIGLAVDGEGNVYVTDSNAYVQKFSNDGKYLLSMGSEGTGDGQFRHPTGL